MVKLDKLLRAMHFGDEAEVVMTTDYYEPPSVMEDEGHEQFALLMTDIVLTGPMNGVEVAQNLKSRIPGLNILFLSGYADEGAVASRRSVKGAAFIQKPFVMADLLRSTEEMLARKTN